MMTSKVTLNEFSSANVPDGSRTFPFRPDGFPGDLGSKTKGSVWESFDEIRLTRTDGKKWHAEVVYRSKEGKKVSKNYDGTREEIRKAIQAGKEICRPTSKTNCCAPCTFKNLYSISVFRQPERSRPASVPERKSFSPCSEIECSAS